MSIVTPIDAGSFLAEARAHGVGVDPLYASNWPRDLSFEHDSATRRYWEASEYTGPSALLIEAALESLGAWAHVVLWSKCAPLGDLLGDAGIDELARLAERFPVLGSHGGVRFERSEAPVLVALLDVLMQHGWNTKTDVYIVPDAFDAVLMVDHHQVIHAEFAGEERCAAYEQAMTSRGFPLGDDPFDRPAERTPDGTM